LRSSELSSSLLACPPQDRTVSLRRLSSKVASAAKDGILILMPTYKLTSEIVAAAIAGFEQQKLRIDAQIAELRAMLPGGPGETAAKPGVPKGKRRKFSAAARRRMKEAQQQRWAKIRGESAPAPTTQELSKPKRKLSKAGRAAIVAALKKRWAAKRVEAAKAAPTKPARKKASAKKAAIQAPAS
jgi:hypothetical protein